MMFDATVVIAGICSYVPDREISTWGMAAYKDSPHRLWVLFPDARRRRDKVRAIDGRQLTTHYPVLRFNSADLADKGSADVPQKVLTSILRHNVTIIPDPERGNELSIVQDGTTSDFRHGVHIRELSHDFVEVDPECFNDIEQHRLLGARVLLNYGRVESYKLNDKQKWGCSDVLGSEIYSRFLSHQVSITFCGLERLTIALTPFGSNDSRYIVLSSSVDLETLEIGNLCEECLLPELSQEEPSARSQDDDFRWHFEIAKDRLGIRDRLKKFFWISSLPIPEREGFTSGGGSRLVECMRMTYAAANAAWPELKPDLDNVSLEMAVRLRAGFGEKVKADSPYHRQAANFMCGAAAAMMVLADAEVGKDVSKLSQELIYRTASQMSPAPWHINPTALAQVLNKELGKAVFGVNLRGDWESGCQDIIAALLKYKIPPAVVIESDDHWVAVEEVFVDGAPENEDFTLLGLWFRDPWCRSGCPSKHRANDDCPRYGTPEGRATYWEWAKMFREVSWKESNSSVNKRGFVTVTEDVSGHKVGKIKRPKKIKFVPGGLSSAVDLLSEAMLLDEDEKALFDGSSLEGPLAVRRRDAESESYYLFGFTKDEEVIAQVKVNIESGAIERLQIENDDSREWSIFGRRVRHLRESLQSQRAHSNADLSEFPPLVWQPCDESRTPFLPFFELSDNEDKYYLRIDNNLPVLSELTTSNKGV